MNIDEKKIDEKFRVMISNVLRLGVSLSSILIIIGGVLFFIQHPNTVFDYATFKSEPSKLKDLVLIGRNAFSFYGRDVIQMGLLILIATPFLRVLFSLIGFAIEKDCIYVFITGIVLVVLSFSIFG